MNMLRTSLVLDRDLVNEAMELSETKTKKSVIEYALFEFVERRKKKDLRDIKGTIEFADGYDYKAMRAEKVTD